MNRTNRTSDFRRSGVKAGVRALPDHRAPYIRGGGGLLTICQGQKSYKKGQLLPVDLARLNQGKNPSHSQNGS